VSVGPEYFAALNPNFLLQIATSLLTYAPQQVSHSPLSLKGVRMIFVRGSMPSCCLRLKNFEKPDYEMVHSEVNLKKICGQHSALLHVFSFKFFIHFTRGSRDPICPCVQTPMLSLLPGVSIFDFGAIYIVCLFVYRMLPHLSFFFTFFLIFSSLTVKI